MYIFYFILFIYLFIGGWDFLRISLKYLKVKRKGQNLKKRFCFHYPFECLCEAVKYGYFLYCCE